MGRTRQAPFCCGHNGHPWHPPLHGGGGLSRILTHLHQLRSELAAIAIWIRQCPGTATPVSICLCRVLDHLCSSTRHEYTYKYVLYQRIGWVLFRPGRSPSQLGLLNSHLGPCMQIALRQRKHIARMQLAVLGAEASLCPAHSWKTRSSSVAVRQAFVLAGERSVHLLGRVVVLPIGVLCIAGPQVHRLKPRIQNTTDMAANSRFWGVRVLCMSGIFGELRPWPFLGCLFPGWSKPGVVQTRVGISLARGLSTFVSSRLVLGRFFLDDILALGWTTVSGHASPTNSTI